MKAREILKIFYAYLSFLFLMIPVVEGQDNNRLIGDWRTYLSHKKVIKSVARGEEVFTITTGGMFVWDDANKEIRTFSTVEGMSGINPTTIHYDPASNQIFIGYSDGMIDFFEEPDQIKSLTDIQRNSFFTQKRINQFASDGSRLFVATDFGLVVYRLENSLPEFTITQIGDNPNREPVQSVALYEDKVWAVLGIGELYNIPISFPNLTDPSAWISEKGQFDLPFNVFIEEIGANSTHLYARVDNGVYRKENGAWALFPPFNDAQDRINIQENFVSATRLTRTTLVGPDGNAQNLFLGSSVTDFLVANGIYYPGYSVNGLERIGDGERINITPEGPTNNLVTRVAAGNGELYIAPKGHTASFGPDLDASGIYYFNQDLGWRILNRVNGGLNDVRANRGFARVSYDANSGKAYGGSWGTGMVELQNGELLNFYDCENSGLSIINAPCTFSNAQNTRVSGIDTDDQGNVWASVAFGQDPLVMRSPEGEWVTFPANRFPSSIHFLDLLVDNFGTKWMVNQRAGLVIYNDRRTPEDLSDDIMLSLRTGVGNGNLENEDVKSLAMDQEGFIWVGTAKGVYVFFDPFSISEGVIADASAPIFERRKLLNEETINAIAVDGGDRKWIGTENGLYLVNPAGDKLIYHFTTENSPLLSNSVSSLAIDGSTGEVFIGTEAGLLSYLGEATTGVTDCESLFIYPNPMFTDEEAPLVIRGISRKSTVKITTISGQLVRELPAETGGTAIWDGNDIRGNKVHSGVYLALIQDPDGGYPCAGKFTVIRR